MKICLAERHQDFGFYMFIKKKKWKYAQQEMW